MFRSLIRFGSATATSGMPSIVVNPKLAKAAQLMQSFDTSGIVPVPSFAYKLLTDHPSLRAAGFEKRMSLILKRWKRLSAKEKKCYVDRPLQGLLQSTKSKRGGGEDSTMAPDKSIVHKKSGLGIALPASFEGRVDYVGRTGHTVRVSHYTVFMKKNFTKFNGTFLERKRAIDKIWRQLTSNEDFSKMVLKNGDRFANRPCFEVVSELRAQWRRERKQYKDKLPQDTQQADSVQS